MSSSNFNTINNVLTTSTIIAIVIGSISGLVFLIGSIIVIVCIVKRINRTRNVAVGGIILPSSQYQQYPYSWNNQYPPNITSVANYPPPYPPTAPPYTATAPSRL